jgi:hypothetical protein
MIYVVAVLLLILVLANDTARGILTGLLGIGVLLAISGVVLFGICWGGVSLWSWIRADTVDRAPVSARWNRFNNMSTNSKVIGYFDADSIERESGDVILWTMDVKNQPSKDRSFAIARKLKYSCSNRTVQLLDASKYDKDGTFIKSYPKKRSPKAIPPGTFSEWLLPVVCGNDFPDNPDRGDYSPVDANDVYKDAAGLFQFWGQ